MANQSMGRVFFALYRETTDDATRAKDDPYGVFSCIASTARFLDITDKSFSGVILIKRKAGTRALVRADGTTLTAKETTNQVVETQIAKQFKAGGRSIILKTGKRIYPNDPKKTQVHTLNFSFPTWATVPTIADALGELIPTGKIDASPGQAEIYPYFWLKGGGRYGILKKTVAESNTDASTATALLAQRIAAQGGELLEGAG